MRRETNARIVRRYSTLTALSIVALLAALGLSPAASAGAGRHAGPVPGSLGAASDPPTLTLAPTPATGSAPVNLSLIATVAGGTPPYNLSICFGTEDHTSPSPPCGIQISGWSGAGPLVEHHLYATPGNFSVLGLLSDAGRASVGSTALVVVTTGRTLAASGESYGSGGPAPYSVRFNESVVGGTPPFSIEWTFGDGAVGSQLPGQPVDHVYASSGVFQPVLTVIDGVGHRVSQTLPAIHVAVAPSAVFGIPTTPTVAALGPPVLGFVIAAALIGGLVRVAQIRRWRSEGNAIVEQLRAHDEARAPPRRAT